MAFSYDLVIFCINVNLTSKFFLEAGTLLGHHSLMTYIVDHDSFTIPGKHAAVQCSGEIRIVATCSRDDCLQLDISTNSCC